MIYCFGTQRDKYYYIKEDNNTCYLTSAERYHRLGDEAFSKNWRFCGIQKINNNGYLGNLYLNTPKEIINYYNEERNKDNFTPFRYKNGKGKFVIFDCDHGTNRMWYDRIVSFFLKK